MNFGLTAVTIDKFKSVFSKYAEIDEVIIYGSRAKGNYREGSDIDFTIIGHKLNENIRSKLWLDLDDLNTPYLIDISIFSSITSESLIEHIKRVGKVFYKKEN